MYNNLPKWASRVILLRPIEGSTRKFLKPGLDTTRLITGLGCPLVNKHQPLSPCLIFKNLYLIIAV